MGHHVRQRPLQQLLVGDLPQRRADHQQAADVHDEVVEPRDFQGDGGERLRLYRVGPAEKVRADIAHETGHMPQDRDRRAGLVSGGEVPVRLGRIAYPGPPDIPPRGRRPL